MQPKRDEPGKKVIASRASGSPAIDPTEYNRIVENLLPVEVRLDSVSFSICSGPSGNALLSECSLQAPVLKSCNSLANHSDFLIEHSAEFSVIDSNRTVIATGRARFIVVLRCGFEPPQSFWNLFLPRNIKLYTYPVLRELVSGLSSKSGLLVQPLSSIAVVQSVSRSES